MRAGRDERRRQPANGDVAQLGERLTGSQKVTGSTPVFSTILAGASGGHLTGRGGAASCLRMLMASSLTVDQVMGVRSSSWARRPERPVNSLFSCPRMHLVKQPDCRSGEGSSILLGGAIGP